MDRVGHRDSRQLIEQAGPPVVEIDTERAGRLCPPLRTEGLLRAARDPGARDIDVIALHAGYVRAFQKRGGHVELRARLTRAEPGPHGWTIHTCDGREVVSAHGRGERGP